MGNIFLCTDGFTDRTLAHEFNYVTGIQADTIYMLSESHSEYENIGNNIKICNSVSEGVKLCDSVYTTNKKIQEFFQENEKKVNFIRKTDYLTQQKDKVSRNSIKFNFAQKPVVVILSVSNYSDSYYVEVTVNKIFAEAGAMPSQLLSRNTKIILNKFIGDCFLSQHSVTDGSVLIMGMSCCGYSYVELLSYLQALNPDLVFVCSDRDHDGNDLVKYLSLICNRIYCVRSPYFIFENIVGKKIPIYCSETEKNNDCIYTTDCLFYEKIRDIIYSVLYRPNNIRIIK